MDNNHPLAVYCKSCGAPANYDIIRQQYLCQYCGGVTDIKDPIMRLEQWRDARRKSILQGKNAAEEVHSCQNCGAQVMLNEGAKMVHRSTYYGDAMYVLEKIDEGIYNVKYKMNLK